MNSHLYRRDAREQHGTSRRSIQPVDGLSLNGGIGGGWQESGAATFERDSAVYAPTVVATASGYGGAYGSSHCANRGDGAYSRHSASNPGSSCGDPLSTDGGHFAGGARSVSEIGSRMGGAPGHPHRGNPRPYQQGTRSAASSQRGHANSVDHDSWRRLSEEERALMGRGVESMQAEGVPYHMTGDLFGRRGNDYPEDYCSAQAPQGRRGRMYIEEADHKVTHQDQRAGPNVVETGRRLIIPYDHLKEEVMRPVEEIKHPKRIQECEMKDSVKEWMETVQAMIVCDERKWADVEVKPKGCHWVVEAFNDRRQSVGREGPTAKALAEKLAMMPVAELRFFGVRFAAPNEIKRAGARPVKGRPNEDNPTLVSPGVHNALNKDDYGLQGSSVMSSGRKNPETMQRRYIASGKAHFNGSNTVPDDPDPCALHGRAMTDRSKGDTFDGGIARGIGRGKRHIAKESSVAQIFGADGPWA